MAKYILVVEDDDAVAELVADILEEDGHVVDRTASADDGLARMQADRPDLVLLDLTLTGTSGLSFLARCKSDLTLAMLPIVVMSGSAASATERGLSPDGVIQKPFDIDELCRVVSHFVGDEASDVGGAPA